MPDTLTAAPSAASGVSATTPTAPVAPQSIADAGAAFKAPGATWEDVGLPAMAVTDGDDDAPAGGAAAPVAPVAPGAEGSAPGADADAPEFVQNAQGQWHRPDGTFANAEEIAAIDAQIAADAAAAPAATAPAAETPPENIVTLRRRDGTTRDVIVEDPELAQEIRQNMNDGMRKKEFVEKSAAVEARLAEFQQLDAMLEKNPELVVQRSLNPEQKIRLATMLLAEHFDVLVPIIQNYDANPATRITATTEAQLRMRDQEQEFQTFTTAQKAAQAVRATVETLIPETAAPEAAEQFWADAGADLQRAIARGERVDPSTVPNLLKHRMTLYGFEAPAGSTPAVPATPRITAVPAVPAAPTAGASASPAAVPVGDAAQALATATAAQKRIRLTQRNRANAAAVPPVGAGAAPVRLPPVPAGASIEEASAAMKKMRSWAS